MRIADLVLGIFVSLGLVTFAVAAWADTAAERAARLAKLPPAEKEALLRKKKHFDNLDPAEQERLRKLHKSLSAAPDAQQLDGVLVRYSNWLRALQSTQRTELLSLPPDERIERIKKLVREQERQRFQDFAESNLPPADQELIYQWLDKFAAQHEEEILDALPDHRDRRRIREIEDDTARRRALIARLGLRFFNPRMPCPSKDEINQMVASLSETTRKELDKAKDANERRLREDQIVGAAIFSITYPPPSDDELRKFYAELPAEKRAALEHLDADQLQPELKRMYRMEKYGRWGGGRGGPRPPGGDGPRGRGPGPGPGGPPPDRGQPPPGFASPAPDKNAK
jgi:hypothetical protein